MKLQIAATGEREMYFVKRISLIQTHDLQ
uniref:Uncharacterized protein n=1 Tax=Rhizophora mucronata TaxID=61149 RepID=A0A2P2P8H6_RHIMU